MKTMYLITKTLEGAPMMRELGGLRDDSAEDELTGYAIFNTKQQCKDWLIAARQRHVKEIENELSEAVYELSLAQKMEVA